jgi:hypothetical protein
MHLPVPVTESCSHPCGTPLATIIVGPFATVVISAIVLFFQAIFLGHGGITISIDTPKGYPLTLPLSDILINEDNVTCAVKKDSGDGRPCENAIIKPFQIKQNFKKQVFCKYFCCNRLKTSLFMQK